MRLTLITLILIAVGGRAHAQSTGYPACDQYISMVTECIKTKMPASERADKQKQLDVFREVLANPMFGQTAATKCDENIRLEMQRDRYGCYAARAAAAGVKTACTLLTTAELSEILGMSFGAGQPANAACVYPTQAPGRDVRIEVAWNRGREEMDAWRGGVAQAKRQIRKDTGQSAPVGAETVTGIGDDAFLVTAGFTPFLAARKGDTALTVRAHGASRDQLIAVVRKALSRLP